MWRRSPPHSKLPRVTGLAQQQHPARPPSHHWWVTLQGLPEGGTLMTDQLNGAPPKKTQK